MPRTALVTGCAGFIASHLTDRLLKEGYRVIGIDNFRTGRTENIAQAMESPEFVFYEQDITSPSFVESFSEDIDIVFHLAAIASVALSTKDPLVVNECNVEGTLNVLEVARGHGAERFVFSSSAAVYGNPDALPVREEYPLRPLSPYAASKIAGEYYIRSYRESFGLEYATVRLFNVYGPRQDDSEYSGVIAIFADRAVTGRPLVVEGDGLQTRSFIHVHDVVEALARAGEMSQARGQTLNVSGTDSITVLEVARQISDMTGAEIVHTEARIGDVRDSIGDMTRTRSTLGLEISTPLTQGLRETVDWYQSRP